MKKSNKYCLHISINFSNVAKHRYSTYYMKQVLAALNGLKYIKSDQIWLGLDRTAYTPMLL